MESLRALRATRFANHPESLHIAWATLLDGQMPAGLPKGSARNEPHEHPENSPRGARRLVVCAAVNPIWSCPKTSAGLDALGYAGLPSWLGHQSLFGDEAPSLPGWFGWAGGVFRIGSRLPGSVFCRSGDCELLSDGNNFGWAYGSLGTQSGCSVVFNQVCLTLKQVKTSNNC